MTTWALLAPGPSASAELAAKVRHLPTGAIGCAFQLAPWAQFVAASDRGWWRKYPEALRFPERFAMMPVDDVERVNVPGVGAICNSGVLGLEAAKLKGASRILLLGFDMHGAHFFGAYTNGLRNTNESQRRNHLRQFADWGRANKGIEVVNCTEGSSLTCFPTARLDETGIFEPAAHEAGQGGSVFPGAAA
jgi:hypothetical protein